MGLQKRKASMCACVHSSNKVKSAEKNSNKEASERSASIRDFPKFVFFKPDQISPSSTLENVDFNYSDPDEGYFIYERGHEEGVAEVRRDG